MTVKAESRTNNDVKAAELALDKLLSAIIAHDAARAEEPRKPIKATPFEGVSFDGDGFAQINFKGMVRDPIGHALRQGVKRFGRELHRLGGLAAMHDAINRFAEMDRLHPARRMSIMDSAWDGIGEGDARWWA